ncbi:MAG: DegV family protein [Clostridiales bacterium]|jgi:DegV family protein with EDD domain|nr:DegV family protein [Clostridiales bacterium]
MGRVLISADSGCDLFPNLYSDYQVFMIPLSIHMEGRSFLDGVEIQPDDIYASVLRSKKIPTTAAPPPADFYRAWKPHVDQGDQVVHISINSGFSCSYQNANLAARELGNVFVVDSRSISTAMGLLVLRAAKMRDQGFTAPEIAQTIKQMRHRLRTEFLLDTLEYAHKGGRCSILQCFGANLLRLRPCLKVNRLGEISVSKKFRGSFTSVVEQYVDYMLNVSKIDGERVFISHTGVSSSVLESVIEKVEQSGIFQEILVTRSGCTISCHGGPNTLGIFYMTKEED